MYILKLKNNSNSTRHQINLKKSLLCKNSKILKSLSLGSKVNSGRGLNGRITIGHKGAGVKRLFRDMRLHFKKSFALLIAVFYDARRTAFISLFYNFLTLKFFNSLHTLNTYPGSILFSYKVYPDLRLGLFNVLKHVPTGSSTHNPFILDSLCHYTKVAGMGIRNFSSGIKERDTQNNEPIEKVSSFHLSDYDLMDESTFSKIFDWVGMDGFTQTLILVGASGTGKSELALTLLTHVLKRKFLTIRSLGDLEFFDKRKHFGLLIDGLSFRKRDSSLNLIDSDSYCSFRIKYCGLKELPAGIPRIVTTNFLGVIGTLPELARKARIVNIQGVLSSKFIPLSARGKLSPTDPEYNSDLRIKQRAKFKELESLLPEESKD